MEADFWGKLPKEADGLETGNVDGRILVATGGTNGARGLRLGWKEPVSGQGSVLLPGSGRGLAGGLAQAPPLTETRLPPTREVVDSRLSSTGPQTPRHLDSMLGVLVRVFPGEHLNL